MWWFGVSILGLRFEFAVVLGLCRVGIIYVFVVLFGLGFGILVLGVTCWVLGCVIVAGVWHVVAGCGGGVFGCFVSLDLWLFVCVCYMRFGLGFVLMLILCFCG